MAAIVGFSPALPLSLERAGRDVVPGKVFCQPIVNSGCPSLCTSAALAAECAPRSLGGNAAAGPSLVSSFSGEKVRMKPIVACACAGKTIQTVAAVPRDGAHHGEKPWDSLRGLYPSTDKGASAAMETSAVATDRTMAESRNGLFGYSQGTDDEYDGVGDLRHASNASTVNQDELSIAGLGIPLEVVDALAKRGITHLFPIQRAVLDPAMQGRDLIGRARTGTGKTLAFGIPIIHHIVNENEQNRLARRMGRAPRALVLAPTRELAKQVEREFMESAPMLSTICVYGGVSITAQQRQLQRGVDVAVGTPGRITDLIDRGSLNLHDVRFVVLDEADQMLAVGFEEDVERILEKMPQQRQSMLFSATMPVWIKKLARKYLNDPLTIDLVGESDEKLAKGIKLFAVSTPAAAKRSILNDLIAVYGKGGKSIVFTQTKRDADDVALAMGRIVGCEALHGDITQNQREKTLNSFREGKFSVLVATDVAARGLDIPNVDLVIHFEIPNDPETFVHRSGRTGRAGKLGTAILMYSDNQLRTMRLIERDVGCKFERIGAPHVEEVLRASSNQATEVIKRVHPELAQVFLPTAEFLLREQGPGALAAALAHLSGYSQPPASRSLITHEEGWITLRLLRSGNSGRPLSARVVMGVLSEIWQRAADTIGKIRIIDDPQMEGAVFDLPEDVAKELLSRPPTPGDAIDVPKKLPQIEEDEFAARGRGGDMYGRSFSRGGGGSSGGRSSGGFDRTAVLQGRAGNSFSGGGRFDDRSRGNFSSNRPETNDRSGGFSSGRSDWGSSGGYISRGNAFSGGSFSGTCYLCNQAGHRAADCPTRR